MLIGAPAAEAQLFDPLPDVEADLSNDDDEQSASDTLSSTSDDDLLNSSSTTAALTDHALVDRLSAGRPSPVLLFGGVDLWRNGLSTYGAFEWDANPQETDGFILRMSMLQGLERYQTAPQTYYTTMFRAALLPGWRFKRGAFELKLLAGPALENRNFSPDVVDQRWRGANGGLHIAAETWAEPASWLMLTSAFYATTVASGVGGRVAAGFRLVEGAWIGPEVSRSRDEFSRQTRIGVNLTGLHPAEFEWSAAAGYVSDSYGRSGIYTRLGAVLRP